MAKCPVCEGTGKLENDGVCTDCPFCNGTGEADEI